VSPAGRARYCRFVGQLICPVAHRLRGRTGLRPAALPAGGGAAAGAGDRRAGADFWRVKKRYVRAEKRRRLGQHGYPQSGDFSHVGILPLRMFFYIRCGATTPCGGGILPFMRKRPPCTAHLFLIIRLG
jgi:hypothetical protein